MQKRNENICPHENKYTNPMFRTAKSGHNSNLSTSDGWINKI
jgi:hypothetical protein